MLPEKPWKADAILRLVASVVLCIFLGSIVDPAVRFFAGPRTADPLLFIAATVGAIAGFVGALVLLGRPWKSETFPRNFGAILVCVYAAFFFAWWQMHLLQGKPPPEEWTWWRVLVAVLSFQGVAFVLIHRFLREHQMTWSEAFNFKLHWPSALTFGLMTGLAIVPVVLLLQFSVQLVLSRFGLAPDEQTAVQVIRNAESWPGRLVMGFATILLVPPAEELLFRGIAYPAIKRAGYPRLALWGTSVLFAAIHGNLAILAPLTLLAMALVWLYEKTGNLLAPIAAHSLFNAINFGLVYALPWLQERVPSVFQQP